MKCGTRVALGLTGGYLLGRSRKMKAAMFLAILAAGGKLPADPNELVRRIPLLGGGGPLDEVTADLRERLVDAGKTAAMTAASNRIDSLSDKLERRTATLQGTRAAAKPASEEEEEAGEYEAEEHGQHGQHGRRPRGRTAPEERDEDEYENGGHEERRHLRTRPRPGTTR